MIVYQTLGTNIVVISSVVGMNSRDISSGISNSPTQFALVSILGSLQNARGFTSVPANNYSKQNNDIAK